VLVGRVLRQPLAPRGRGLALDCRVVRISRGPRGRRRISRYANCRAELCSIARVIRRGRTRRARLTRFCGRPVHRTTTRLHETGSIRDRASGLALRDPLRLRVADHSSTLSFELGADFRRSVGAAEAAPSANERYALVMTLS